MVSYFKIPTFSNLKILLLFLFTSGYSAVPTEEGIIPDSARTNNNIPAKTYLSADSLKSKENISVSNTDKAFIFITHDAILYDPENQLEATKVIVKLTELHKQKIKNVHSSKLSENKARNEQFHKISAKPETFVNPLPSQCLSEARSVLNCKCANTGGQYFNFTLPETPIIPGRPCLYFTKELLSHIFTLIISLKGNLLFCRPPPLA